MAIDYRMRDREFILHIQYIHPGQIIVPPPCFVPKGLGRNRG